MVLLSLRLHSHNVISRVTPMNWTTSLPNVRYLLPNYPRKKRFVLKTSLLLQSSKALSWLGLVFLCVEGVSEQCGYVRFKLIQVSISLPAHPQPLLQTPESVCERYLAIRSSTLRFSLIKYVNGISRFTYHSKQ